MYARQSAPMAILRLLAKPCSKIAAHSKKLRAAKRRDFFEKLTVLQRKTVRGVLDYKIPWR